MNYWNFFFAFLGLALTYKICNLLTAYFDRKLIVINCQLKIEQRKHEILMELDQTIKEQEELQETYKLYTDLGDEKKLLEIKIDFQKSQSKYFTLKNRIV